jgi:hypothetical protein
MGCANCGGGLEPVGNRDYSRCPYCQTFHLPKRTADGVAVTGEPAGCDRSARRAASGLTVIGRYAAGRA